jgi:uncharacterized protein YegL
MNQSTQNLPQKVTIVTGGPRRPNWICRNVRQNCVLVRDRSGSMRGDKARDASAASLDLVAELAQPINKDGFSVAVVDFADSANVIHSLEKAVALNGNVKPLSGGFLGWGSTNITDGLDEALRILVAAETKNEPGVSFLRPVVLMFTDGCHNTGPRPKDVADKIKAKADLVAVAFGSDADEALLKELASTPQHFYRVSNGRELRTFLACVGATMTATRAQGLNATQALTQIRQTK